METYNIKTKTAGKCRVYPDSPNGHQPSVTSICGALMKYGLIDWAANCAVDYVLGWYGKYLSKDAAATEDEIDRMPNLLDVLKEARHAHEHIQIDRLKRGE